MYKQQFLELEDVSKFIGWLSKNISQIEINLKVGKSRFVPEPIDQKIIGIENVLQRYTWKSAGMEIGDWNETKNNLSNLSVKLKEAVNRKNEKETLKICKDILSWGGNRNWNSGAFPFLEEKANSHMLCDYIIGVGNALSLENADLCRIDSSVEKMNAMLTKVHALYSKDGLPIYDSRVAASIASLVELWRIEEGYSNSALPSSLSFPATVSTRSVYSVFPDTQFVSGLLGYDLASAKLWASAKVRLGLILEAVLERNNQLFLGENRMHAFEACLFMLGYNVHCLARLPVDDKKSSAKAKTYRSSLMSRFLGQQNQKIIPYPLSGNGSDIQYRGNLEEGFYCKWGKTYYGLEPDILEGVLNNFSGMSDVKLGAEQGGAGGHGSLGGWLKEEFKLSPKLASLIGAVLVNEGFATSRGKKPILLTFL